MIPSFIANISLPQQARRASGRGQRRARVALYGSPDPMLNSSRGNAAADASAIPIRWRLRGAQESVHFAAGHGGAPKPKAKCGAGPESCGDGIGSAAAKEADATVDAAEHMLEQAEPESLVHSREPR